MIPTRWCIFITTARVLAKRVQKEVQKRTRATQSPRNHSRGAAPFFWSLHLNSAVEISNRIAPEHLTLPAALAPAVRHAGAVFLDEFTPQRRGRLHSPDRTSRLPHGWDGSRAGRSQRCSISSAVIACQPGVRAGIRRIAAVGALRWPCRTKG